MLTERPAQKYYQTHLCKTCWPSLPLAARASERGSAVCGGGAFGLALPRGYGTSTFRRVASALKQLQASVIVLPGIAPRTSWGKRDNGATKSLQELH